MIYRVMAWYGLGVTLVIIASGLTFAYLYHTRTGGEWRSTDVGRNLMYFVMSPTAVLVTAIIRIHQVWWALFSMAVYSTVPAVYIHRILVFLRVQKESELESDSDH